MKRKILIFSVLTMILSLCCVSCKKKSNGVIVNPEEVKTSYNFEECYSEDWRYMQDNYLEKYGKDNVLFFWAEAKLNQNLRDSIVWDTLYVNEVTTLFQVYKEDSSFCVQFTHPYKMYNEDSVKIEAIPGHWLECLNIDIDSIDNSLLDIMTIFDTISVDKSTLDNKVIMRCPIFPPFPKHPYWFFGNELQYLVIDSKGNVISKK